MVQTLSGHVLFISSYCRLSVVKWSALSKIMSRPNFQSPISRRYNSSNSPDSINPGNFRSPFFSPEKGASPDFQGSSPMKNFGWRNSPRKQNRRYYQNDYSQNYNFSPGCGGRRGGGRPFRSGGARRGGQRHSESDISLYADPSMLNDPWKDFGPQLDHHQSISSSPPDHQDKTKLDDTKEDLTEDTIQPVDASADISSKTLNESQNRTVSSNS